MRKSVSFLIVMAIVAFSAIPASANPNVNTPISGTYEGSLETKSFFENNTNGKSSSTTNSNVELLFNGNVFIYQDNQSKCMGSYSLEGDILTFTITSTKGNAENLKSIFSGTFKYSKSGNKLMLISDDNPDGNILICKLSKTKS